jgi:hypothetical protein
VISVVWEGNAGRADAFHGSNRLVLIHHQTVAATPDLNAKPLR